MPQPRMRLYLLVSLATFAVAAPIPEQISASRADVRVKNQPASEGRPITPAGRLVFDATQGRPAVGSLPVNFVRSPDRGGPGGRGRYLVCVNSGYGLQFSAKTNKAQQSLSVIDLEAAPAPAVVQNVYFPTPQSANVGLAFAPRAAADSSFTMYVSGGFENRIWVFKFTPGAEQPITPASPGPDTKVSAPSIDVSDFSPTRPTPRENDKRANVYPTGLAIGADGATLYVANNLDDSLGIIENAVSPPRLTRVSLHRPGGSRFVLPYGVAALSRDGARTEKVYVSCWNDASIAVVSLREPRSVKFIATGSHPTAVIFNDARTRLYVVNSNSDSVSVIDTATDREIERIDVRLSERAREGHSPEGLAIGDDGATLYVANAQSNAVAVVSLSARARGEARRDARAGGEARARSGGKMGGSVRARAADEEERAETDGGRSRVRGFIPTGQYPSALAVAGGVVYVGNGKGTGFENSSTSVDNSGRVPNAPNEQFPPGTGHGVKQGGAYSVALVAGNISAVEEPDARTLAAYTRQVMQNDGLLGPPRARLFRGGSPFRHVVYIIKENRTYDQLFGDLARAGDGTPADGDSSLAIFGAGEAARSKSGRAQNITPNQRALALRFGLLDRFFVNAEASADGHNWSTAAYSNDYVDKAFRWNYSSRGRTYDFEGFHRLPNIRYVKDTPPLFPRPVTAEEIGNFMRRYVPYLSNSPSASEPATLYLWDAAARARLSYRNYGEYVGTLSEADVETINANVKRAYPDLSPTVKAVPTKKSLEGHHSATYRNFDLLTPDAMTTDSYRAVKETNAPADPLVSPWNTDARLRGYSRVAAWLEEFNAYVADLKAGRGDRLPNLSIIRLPNDHTEGLTANAPTPQFYVAENDYAVGRIVEALSNSPYWRTTAIVIVEDDAQDGPDHVDAHRSPALIVSAYNRPGALVHAYHSTVSLIRTIELMLGLAPMNQLDAAAAPVDLFGERADLRPFKALLPEVALDNLVNSPPRDEASRYWAERTAEQNLEYADQADARVLNGAIWFATRGGECPPPETARLPVVDSLIVSESGDGQNEKAEAARRAR